MFCPLAGIPVIRILLPAVSGPCVIVVPRESNVTRYSPLRLLFKVTFREALKKSSVASAGVPLSSQSPAPAVAIIPQSGEQGQTLTICCTAQPETFASIKFNAIS